jgi:hypothetical protein
MVKNKTTKIFSSSNTPSYIFFKLTIIILSVIMIYFLYRVISVLLIIYALSIYFYFRRFINKGDYLYSFWLLLPFISWVPLCLIFYEDTRFRIVPEILFIPASAYLIAQLKSVILTNSKLPTQN